MKKEETMITDWLNQNGDQDVTQFIEKNLAITEKVRIALEKKGWSKNQLADAMGKKPSEVSKWLSGMHNITLKSIIKMEIALGIDLIHTEPIKEYEYIILGYIDRRNLLKGKGNDYQKTTESYEYALAI